MKAWELADRLNAAGSRDAVWASGLETLTDLGISKLIWMRMSAAAPPDIRSNCCPDWLAGYGREVAEKGDPFVTHCLSSIAPVRTGIGNAVHQGPMMSEEERAFVAQACEETGMVCGMSVTTAIGAAGWNLLTDLDANAFDGLFTHRGADISLCAHLIDTALTAHAPAPRPVLSPRERDCLTYVAAGRRVTQISDQLGITETTVEFHLRNTRRKLRAATRDEAVARALIMGEIAV